MQKHKFHSAWFGSDGTAGDAGAACAYFPWWSFTKTVLAICALRLVEQGRLQLDGLRPDKPYTLRQLLQHRAGVPDYGSLTAYHQAVARSDVPWSREYLLDAVGNDSLDFHPGSGWAYSNVGYMFVREAIEKASGLSLAFALEELVLAPLGMPNVRLATAPSDFHALFWTELRNYDPRWVYHGCLMGTPADAAKMLHSLFSGTILKPETMRTMLGIHDLGGAMPSRLWMKCGYGLGLMAGEMVGAGIAMGHSGSGPFSVNAVYHFFGMANPITVATFTDGQDVDAAESEAMSIAMRLAKE